MCRVEEAKRANEITGNNVQKAKLKQLKFHELQVLDGF